MAKCIINIKCKVAFWLKIYLYGIALFSYISGLTPNWTKVRKMIDKGIKFKIVS